MRKKERGEKKNDGGDGDADAGGGGGGDDDDHDKKTGGVMVLSSSVNQTCCHPVSSRTRKIDQHTSQNLGALRETVFILVLLVLHVSGKERSTTNLAF